MEEIKRACVYTRVSTDAQGEDGKVSLSEQERMCKAGIESKGWKYVCTFEDNGYTGRNTHRPALQRMISAIESGEIDAVFIYKLDRLSRKQKDTLSLIEDVFLSHNVDVVSLRETLDTTTPWGRAMIGILSSFNQLESETIAERTKLGRYAAARNGKYAGGKPPIGYKVVDGVFIIVPEEAVIVKLIFKLRKEGETLTNICKYLNSRGFRTRRGGLFQQSSVKAILDNESTYRGHYKYGKEGHDNVHDAILTD